MTSRTIYGVLFVFLIRPLNCPPLKNFKVLTPKATWKELKPIYLLGNIRMVCSLHTLFYLFTTENDPTDNITILKICSCTISIHTLIVSIQYSWILRNCGIILSPPLLFPSFFHDCLPVFSPEGMKGLTFI